MHLSGYNYYDYTIIISQRPLWFPEILFWIGILLSQEVKELNIIIVIISYIQRVYST